MATSSSRGSYPFFFCSWFFSSLLISLLCAVATALDRVPVKDRFRYVNEGEFVDYSAEYGATYRPLDVVGSPFQLAFYNTTPNAYTLAIRMGTPRSNSIRRWVWEANGGRPVRENATLTFGADGDLVLADADGTVVWSTGTARRGVVGIEILHSGNMVLHDKKRRFIWQSFDYPTDTLLVGQSLPSPGATRLTSRKSELDGSPGRYSLAVENGDPVLFLGGFPKFIVYYNATTDRGYGSGTSTTAPETFSCLSDDGNATYRLSFGSFATYTKYDSTLSFLRLTPDGDVVFYTYDDRVGSDAWEKTFALFDPALKTFTSACYRPSKCGSLGVCEDGMCSACPTPKGLAGWSTACAPPKRGACRAGANPAGYFKVAGVEHFLTRYSEGEGSMSVGECRRRCSRDCDCQGFLYWEESSKCWLAPVLGTLDKVTQSKHAIYIKSS